MYMHLWIQPLHIGGGTICEIIGQQAYHCGYKHFIGATKVQAIVRGVKERTRIKAIVKVHALETEARKDLVDESMQIYWRLIANFHRKVRAMFVEYEEVV
eukprot:gene9272-2999_t